MVSKKQISKTSAITKVLTENLQNNDRLDIADLLEMSKETIDDILIKIQEIQVDPVTANYIYDLVSTSNFILDKVYLDFINQEF